MASGAVLSFVSYSREDSEFALKLAADLKAANVNVWLDQLDVQPGERWARGVQVALSNSALVLVILSPASASSTNVEDEITYALEEHKTVIPILHRNCEVPYQLRPLQFVDFRTDYARGLERLLKTLTVPAITALAADTVVAGIARPTDTEPGRPASADPALEYIAPRRAVELESVGEAKRERESAQVRAPKEDRKRLVAAQVWSQQELKQATAQEIPRRELSPIRRWALWSSGLTVAFSLVMLSPNVELQLDLEHWINYFGRISMFGASALVLGLVLGVDLVFTGIHVWQEWKGERYPLYRAFGAIVGFWLPREIGFAVFTVNLALVLWFVGIAAYTGWPGASLGIGALGFVLGARAGDSIVSHWALSLAGYRPNPGLSSTPLYMLEAVLIRFAFEPGLSLDPRMAAIGIALGFVSFLTPLPTMAILRFFLKSSRRERWIPGKPIPDWAMMT